MPKQSHPDFLIKLILRARALEAGGDNRDRGYIMLVTATLGIIVMSLLAAYLVLTDISKNTTSAFVDSHNTFVVAESGMNIRAQNILNKFAAYTRPTGTSPTPFGGGASLTTTSITSDGKTYTGKKPTNQEILAMMQQCIEGTADKGSDDFQCQGDRNAAAGTPQSRYNQTSNWQDIANSDGEIRRRQTSYTAYTFIIDRTMYEDGNSSKNPLPATISSGQTYAGLNAQTYVYTVYASAVDNQNNAGTRANSFLQIDFKSRVIPLFQFAAFYEDDLEMDSQMPMTVSGPVHTNASLRAISYGFNNYTSGFGKTSANFASGDVQAGTRLMDKVTVAGSIFDRVPLGTWRPPGCGGSAASQTINCGVMAVYKGTGDKTDPANYTYFPDFAAVDRTTPLTELELALFGDRMVDGGRGATRLNPPKAGFLRTKNYLTNVVGDYYAKADLRLKFYPTRSMPFDLMSIKTGGSGCSSADLIAANRQEAATLKCSPLTKGQLRSLQQPVLITDTAQTGTNLEILKALRVALAAAEGTPLTLSNLDGSIDGTTGWGLKFKTLLGSIPGLTAGDVTALIGQTPTAIATARGSKFLPPPIQFVSGGANAADNNTNGGFCNSLYSYKVPNTSTRTCNWMTMLQTNIESLTHWNRDGIYVEATDPNLTTAYTAPSSLSLSSGLATDGLAFNRSAADSSATADSFLYKGLAASDRTERGLVFHATVSDDLDGDGTNDVLATDANKISGKDDDGNPIAHVDNYRIYPGNPNTKESPYGFVISGGEELPAPLTIATDQAIYIQGNYNNPSNGAALAKDTAYTASSRRVPAAIMADTITVLSNQCSNNNKQVNCGILDGTSSTPQVADGIGINAAFLSNLMKSASNQAGVTNQYNGGLNKYMRLLENWGGSTSGTYYNYTGSMVNLGESIESDKIPDGAGVPRRNFNYDTNFNSFDGLPPMTPSATYLQQEVFKRRFN
jgi:hypothetical protein